MARPKSEDKRLALLEAAKVAVAEFGLGAATSLIAKNAGVAEGTLFRYFPTKDELLNALYLYLKTDLGVTMMKNFQADASVKERARKVWSGFIDWGLVHPKASKAMRQLAVSDKITQETKDSVARIHPELRKLAEDCITNEFLSCGLSAFGDAIFFSLAETTAEFASREPEKATDYKAAGFEAMWRAMSRD
ncbi:TetR/AcrR family transcriptional regulator [Enterobacteriaceae bacterium H11S18]|uniref:TetR/AcrR family transcriptional regulator n=1 Tax=Enterobacteriaceae TaxID=543 RepID=UPI00192805B0|nr:TetR/AcrR family transcriptional regulator [Dryocola clanedunensis]MCT4708496.1 TetR/AcrR family transcriptional regulator [Dryocola clanedunensis]MCT4711503.1 TetR/AcrR family transcriptional regulator [Dryocola clanedunensis]